MRRSQSVRPGRRRGMSAKRSRLVEHAVRRECHGVGRDDVGDARSAPRERFVHERHEQGAAHGTVGQRRFDSTPVDGIRGRIGLGRQEAAGRVRTTHGSITTSASAITSLVAAAPMRCLSLRLCRWVVCASAISIAEPKHGAELTRMASEHAWSPVPSTPTARLHSRATKAPADRSNPRLRNRAMTLQPVK